MYIGIGAYGRFGPFVNLKVSIFEQINKPMIMLPFIVLTRLKAIDNHYSALLLPVWMYVFIHHSAYNTSFRHLIMDINKIILSFPDVSYSVPQ